MENFKKLLKEEIERTMKGGKVEFLEMPKINDMIQTGICFKRVDENMTPTVCIDSYFEDFKSGEPIGKIVSEIVGKLEKFRVREAVPVKEWISEKYILSHIFYQIVSCKYSEKFLKTVPHRIKGDFAIILRVRIDEDNGEETGTFILNNHHLMDWNLPEEKLFQKAEENTPLFYEPCIQAMQKVIFEDSYIKMPKLKEIKSIKKDFLYVLTNTEKFTGASVIFYSGALKKVCELLHTSELIIIPSSIHEVLIMDGYGNMENLDYIVQEVNNNVLELKEVLSDRIYRYYLDTGEII